MGAVCGGNDTKNLNWQDKIAAEIKKKILVTLLNQIVFNKKRLSQDLTIKVQVWCNTYEYLLTNTMFVDRVSYYNQKR